MCGEQLFNGAEQKEAEHMRAEAVRTALHAKRLDLPAHAFPPRPQCMSLQLSQLRDGLAPDCTDTVRVLLLPVVSTSSVC